MLTYLLGIKLKSRAGCHVVAAAVVLALNLPLLRQAGRGQGQGQVGGCQTVSVQGVRQSRRGQHDGSDNGNIQIYMAAGHVEIMPSNWYQQSQRRASCTPLPSPTTIPATPLCHTRLPASLPACLLDRRAVLVLVVAEASSFLRLL